MEGAVRLLSCFLDWGVRKIYVDDEGFVYVADPGNRRIQKFAP